MSAVRASSPTDVDSDRGGASPSLREIGALLLALLVPLFLYATWVPAGLTFGDGPELLTAVSLGGIAHPSGYPLYLLLGRAALWLPGLSEAWRLGFYLSALPGAVSSGLIFASLRRLSVDRLVSVAAALLFAGSLPVLATATRIEVYALAALLNTATWYSLIRFEVDGTARWAALAWAAQCVAMTNHLLSVFMLVPVILVLVWRRGPWLWAPSTWAWGVGITLAAGSLYALLPITAMSTAAGEALVWNNPDTLGRLIFHVTGAEYDGYRQDPDLLVNLWRLVRAPSLHLFPGLSLLTLAGLALLVRNKHAPLAVAGAVFTVTSFAYDASYQIADIAFYLIPIYAALVIFAAIAVQRLAAAAGAKVGATTVTAVTAVMMLAAALHLSIGNSGERYRDLLAEPMSQDVVATATPGSIVLTEADYQNFPLWYRAYVDRPDLGLAIVNWSMFGRPEMKWYRDFLRARHPQMTWPAEAALDSADLTTFIGANRAQRKIYAMLKRPWRVEGVTPLNYGWVDELVDTAQVPPGVGVVFGRHAYMGRFPHSSERRFVAESGHAFRITDRPLVCVAELLDREVPVEVQVKFRQPQRDGAVVARAPMTVAAGQTMVRRAFPRQNQAPGVWVCDVWINGRPELHALFELQPGN